MRSLPSRTCEFAIIGLPHLRNLILDAVAVLLDLLETILGAHGRRVFVWDTGLQVLYLDSGGAVDAETRARKAGRPAGGSPSPCRAHAPATGNY